MGELYVVEIEPEVRHWLANVSPQHYWQVEEKVELLAERPIARSDRLRLASRTPVTWARACGSCA
jgi:hypothetical protein